jgi:hypothetical protein
MPDLPWRSICIHDPVSARSFFEIIPAVGESAYRSSNAGKIRLALITKYFATTNFLPDIRGSAAVIAKGCYFKHLNAGG